MEKDALSTVISRIATDKYGVTVAVNRGYGSFSFIKKGAERLSRFVDKSIHMALRYSMLLTSSYHEMGSRAGIKKSASR